MGEPNFAWRQKHARGLRENHDIVSDDENSNTSSLNDDVIYQRAKKEIPLVFKTRTLEAKIMKARRSNLDRFTVPFKDRRGW